jgi:hypothetical protein
MRVPAKEKAIELVSQYINLLPLGNNVYKIAKRCALICIDEILLAIDWHEFEAPNKEYEYLAEVIKEIKKM